MGLSIGHQWIASMSRVGVTAWFFLLCALSPSSSNDLNHTPRLAYPPLAGCLIHSVTTVRPHRPPPFCDAGRVLVTKWCRGPTASVSKAQWLVFLDPAPPPPHPTNKSQTPTGWSLCLEGVRPGTGRNGQAAIRLAGRPSGGTEAGFAGPASGGQNPTLQESWEITSGKAAALPRVQPGSRS